MRNHLKAILLSVLFLIAGASAASAITAHDAGLKTASLRGYSGDKAECYATTFASFARLSPRHRWLVGGRYSGRQMTTFRNTLFKDCGISR